MKNILEIKPLNGLGSLRFGMSRDEVTSLLGEPEDVDEYSFSGAEDDLSESWHYDEMDLSMSFDAEDDWRLVTLAVSSPDYQLEGHSLVGLNRDELLSLLESIGIGNISEENELALDMPGHQLVAAHDHFMNFWFEGNRLMEVQWSPRFNDDDEIEWPES